MHQGEIGVISQPGQGSDFFFVLPLIPEQAPKTS
jgi:signal transduction histidine kinase